MIAFPLYAGVLVIGSEATDCLPREQYAAWEWAIRYMGWPDGSFPNPFTSHAALIGTALEDEAREREAEGHRVVTLAAPKDDAAIPLVVQLRFPFLVGDYPIIVPRLSSGSIPEVRVPSEHPSAALGQVDVLFLVPPGLERLDPLTEVGRLEVRRDGQQLEIPVQAFEVLRGLQVGGLPLGTYTWTFYSRGSKVLPRLERPVVPLEVRSDPTDLVVDLSWTTSAEISILDGDGFPLGGPLQVRLLEPQTAEVHGKFMFKSYNEAAAMSWGSPPYIVPFVPPGRYLVHASAEMEHRLLVEEGGPFDFPASDQAKIDLQAQGEWPPVNLTSAERDLIESVLKK